MRIRPSVALALLALFPIACDAAVELAPVRSPAPTVPGMDFRMGGDNIPSWSIDVSAPPVSFQLDVGIRPQVDAALPVQPFQAPHTVLSPNLAIAVDAPISVLIQGPVFNAERDAAPFRDRPGEPSDRQTPAQRQTLEQVGQELHDHPHSQQDSLTGFWDQTRRGSSAFFQGEMKNDSPHFGVPESRGERGISSIAGRIQAESRISFLMEGIEFVTDPILLESIGRGGLRSWFRGAMEAASVMRADSFPKELKSLAGQRVTLVILDRSNHLLEYHPAERASGGQEHVIGINRALFDRISSPNVQRALFAMGLTHELRHAGGKARTDADEKELSQEDARIFRSFVSKEEKERALIELSGVLEPDSLFLFELEKLHADHVWGDSPRGIFAAEIDPKGDKVATAGWDGKVRVWDTHGGRIRASLKDDPNADILALAFEHRGNRLAVGGKDGSVHILGEGKEPFVLPVPSPGGKDQVRVVSFSLDDHLVAGGGESGLVRVWDADDGSPLSQFPHPRPVLSLAFSPLGHALATVDGDGVVRLWYPGLNYSNLVEQGPLIAEESRVLSRAHDDARYGAAFSADSRWLAMSGPGGHVVRVWDVASKSVALSLKITARPEWITKLAFSGDGKLLAGADANGQVHVWEMPSGRLLLRHRFDDSVFGLRFELGTHLLVVVDRDGNIIEVQIP